MKQTVLDRAIGWIAPVAGLRRLRHRAAMDVMSRSYEGAATGRTNASWRTPSTSADAEVAMGSRLLRDRMRDLVRNNPHAANAISVLVTHAVGDGIVPRTKDKRVNALFQEFIKKCDADGQLDFYGIQALAVRGMLESGDGLVRRRRRRRSDGLPVPLQLQVLESDMIDSSKDGMQPNNRMAVQGIEFDALGARSVYWMFGSHPGNNTFDYRYTAESKIVAAEDIAHVYEKQRTQVRGVPWGAPAITPIYDLTGYENAESMRKRMEACMVGVVTGGDSDELGMTTPVGDGDERLPGVYDNTGAVVEKFEPGMFLHAYGGKDIKFSQPAATGNYDAYKNSQLHTIAAGFRVPHALLSGRLDGVNYSSSKVGLEHFKRTISALQWQFIIPMLCEPMWQWFLEAAYADGSIKSMNHPAKWSPPRFYSADPAKDTKALLAEVRAGLKPLGAAIAEIGYDRDEVFEEYADDFKQLDKLGLIFDSDPRHMSGNGQAQLTGANTAPPDKATQ
ncbi:phage portal protein [Rhizobium tumorigenes]|uniref:phage portal protein n=1 Tax=Rhizobium tumorigenes TaxID=2041385 RepID=UPI00241DC80D|nr:phage portal protein [Rhizobium tumorigenes]WFS02782.1 phage portal protein [Rhizobium tumorigenes]